MVSYTDWKSVSYVPINYPCSDVKTCNGNCSDCYHNYEQLIERLKPITYVRLFTDFKYGTTSMVKEDKMNRKKDENGDND